MFTVTAEAALVELLQLMRRSFPQYLKYSHPRLHRHNEEVAAVLDDIVADQNLLAERAAGLLNDMGLAPASTGFPMEFTDTHDLSIGYLIDRAIRHQRNDLAQLTELSPALIYHPSIRSLVDEARGIAQAHLESLEDLRPRNK